MSVLSFLRLGISWQSIFTLFSSIAPFYFTNLLEYYTGVFEYSIGIMNATTAQFLMIILNLLAFFYGGNVYSWEVSETWTFLPGFLAKGFTLGDYVIILVTSCGAIYSFILIWKLYLKVEGFKNYVMVTLNVVQHFALYGMMYLFDGKIQFIHENIGIAYLSILLIYSIITTKLIICLMAKMDFNIFDAEYLVFVPYFYLQSLYDGTEESKNTLRLVFYATFATIIVLYLRLVHCCISQLTDYLEISCFTIKKSNTKEE